mgnify:FL=1
MTDAPPSWVLDEDALCLSTVATLRDMAAAELEHKKKLSDELRELFDARAEACNDATQQAAIDEAIAEVEQQRVVHQRARRARDLDPASPYFGHLVLEEQGTTRQLLIAKGSAVDARLPVNIVDWRNAPISQLYYEFEEGEEFYAEIAGREREGVVAARRTLDIRGGVLQTAENGEIVARKRAGNTWEVKRKADEVLERSDLREDPEDHALPDIVALITPDQFGVLTRPDSGVVVLRGQAGSGKTTVALHRIAYLRYHDPEHFQLGRILVVMFNKALQTYIRGALTELELQGVQVATFHAWASGMLRRAGLTVRFGGQGPPEVIALKQHPAVEGLLVAGIDRLGERLEAWLPVPDDLVAAWEATEGRGLRRLGRFFAERSAAERPRLVGLHDRVWRRLADPLRDLFALAADGDAARRALPAELHPTLPALAQHLAHQRDSGLLDFADAALLLRHGQLVAARVPGFEVPWYRALAHVVVDEAQDLSAQAVRVLLDAADERRSVTLAGDPAQTLYDAGGFGLLSGGGGAVDSRLQLDTLPVGHRSTRPIMELALRASGQTDPELLDRTRPGLPVQWLTGAHASEASVAAAVAEFRQRRPKALVAVLCRTKRQANAWAEGLDAVMAEPVRRGHRDDFVFEPGVVVSNVHQVKGLEFDGVVLVEPSAYSTRDRNLLHVAITRAADQLWVVARGPLGLLQGSAIPARQQEAS